MHRTFLLSPAHAGGERAKLVYNDSAKFELAMKLRTPAGATLGETFSFLSGLYFRAKLRYARHFALDPAHLQVITTNRGLLDPDLPVTVDDLRRMGSVNIDADDARYRKPLERSLVALCERLPPDCDVVLLGSVATGKYVDVLQSHLGDRLKFPGDFVGRGDMSRGGLMLRCVEAGRELAYIPVAGAVRKGKRPPRLEPR